MLSNLGADEAALELSGPLAPGVIRGVGKDDYVHVIMPVRTASYPRADRTGAVRLTRLLLEDFRSYASAELHPEPGLTIVAGPNGAGKTNLLEAVFVAVTGRRTAPGPTPSWCATARPFARVRLDLVRPSEGSRRSRRASSWWCPPRRAARRSASGSPSTGCRGAPPSIGDTVRVVLFRPEEMLLLVGAPSERRRFLDAILAQRHRAAARDLAELARVLAQRNALLRAIRREEATPRTSPSGTSSWPLVGARVMAARAGAGGGARRAASPALHDAVAPRDEQGEQVAPRRTRTRSRTPGRSGREARAAPPLDAARGRLPAADRRGAGEGAVERRLAGRAAPRRPAGRARRAAKSRRTPAAASSGRSSWP